MSSISKSETPIPAITASTILSGLGSLDRAGICAFLAMQEEIGSTFIAKGAFADAGRRLKILDHVSENSLSDAQQKLFALPVSDAVLKHRLWVQLNKSLAVPLTIPFSTRSARRAAAALAVRSSERLSPSVLAQRKKQEASKAEASNQTNRAKYSGLKKEWKDRFKPKDPLSFPDLVKEELVNMFADEELIAAACENADPQIKEALEKAHRAAQKAILAGGGWAAFAAIVGGAGFAPYIIAAQVSSWIPMVGGPTLVSLLATLTNPLTVMVGVGALGWLAFGQGSNIVRSQIAARICVLLAVQGGQESETGLNQFLNNMHTLDRESAGSFDYLASEERCDLRSRLTLFSNRFLDVMPRPAGSPPAPWHRVSDKQTIVEAGLVASLSAGEMFWHAVAIDDAVLKAADFSRTADLGDPFSFAAHAQSFLTEGAGYSLRGYTAEQLVLNELIARGHDVELAGASNTPGYDLIVDGTPVQVKCGSEISNLTEHFEKYPEIPVIANAELALQAAKENYGWAELVTTLPGFEIGLLEEHLAAALGHAGSLADPDILEFALSIGVLRGGLEVMQGRIPVSDLPSWLILDGASRGLLGLVGLKAGGWLGLVFIGPAGAMILGPAMGCAALLANSKLKDRAIRLLMPDWMNELLSRGSDLHQAIASAQEERIRLLSNRTSNLKSLRHGHPELIAWMVARSQDDLIAALEELADLGPPPTEEKQCVELLFKAADLAPTNVRVLKAANAVKQQFATKPGLKEVVIDQQANAARQAYEYYFGNGSKSA